jgi:hypothetical protein
MSRPSYRGTAAARSPQRAQGPRSVASGSAGRTRPGGGAARPPHHTQGKATWGYGHGGHYGYGYGYPYYGYPYYGYPYWDYPYYGYPYYGWGGYYPYGGWGVGIGFGATWVAPYGPYYGGYEEPVPMDDSARADGPPAWVETDVTPKRATVRLDGEDVGFAKDWNGVWDRLPLAPGSHLLEFVLEGHQTLQVHLDARPGRLYHVSRELQAGEGLDPRSSQPPPRMESQAPAPAPDPEARGFLRLSIEPSDAAVYLDGRFAGRASDLQLRRAKPLEPGEHEMEVVRPGFRPQRQTVIVEPGDVQELRIVLDPETEQAPAGASVSSRGSAGSSPA